MHCIPKWIWKTFSTTLLHCTTARHWWSETIIIVVEVWVISKFKGFVFGHFQAFSLWSQYIYLQAGSWHSTERSSCFQYFCEKCSRRNYFLSSLFVRGTFLSNSSLIFCPGRAGGHAMFLFSIYAIDSHIWSNFLKWSETWFWSCWVKWSVFHRRTWHTTM